MLPYHSIQQIADMAMEQKTKISLLVLADQAKQLDKSVSEIEQRLLASLQVMRESVFNGSKEHVRSVSGLTGGDGFRLTAYAAGGGISGSFCAKAMAKAVSVAEYNAAMGKIVAAPTAGSCGILPAAILTYMEEYQLPEEMGVHALATAGAVGLVLAGEASISGAEGGCQAECGSAAAMAAAALVELAGGTAQQIPHACAIALKNMLGLVCDPVAGLVEVPCIKRNAGGVMQAIMAADLALAEVKSVIPADEVIAAMREIGEAMPCSLKETAQGGLAATETARQFAARLFQQSGG